MLKVAMLSFWHVHAEGYAKQLRERNDNKITCMWDEIPQRGKDWAGKLGIDLEPDLSKLLKRDDVDAVVINSPTNLHAKIMIAAAKAGKHIFTEKVMALTVRECKEISEAVKKAGVKFCVSFPQLTVPYVRFAKKAIDEKIIGDVTLARFRAAHAGASAGWLPPHFFDPVQTGGGAMMDLGAHPMYTLRYLLGKPKSINSIFTVLTGKQVEDNSVCAIEFENKAIGVSEASFVSGGGLIGLEVYGTKGCLIVESSASGPVIKMVPAELEKQISLPPALPRPIDIWVDGILKGTEIPFGTEQGTQLTELMEAAYKSFREKRQVSIK